MSDPYRDNEPRRYDTDQTGFRQPLAAALAALGLLIGVLIGYNWGWSAHQKLAQSSPPATTGSAPSPQRPAPETR